MQAPQDNARLKKKRRRNAGEIIGAQTGRGDELKTVCFPEQKGLGGGGGSGLKEGHSPLGLNQTIKLG